MVSEPCAPTTWAGEVSDQTGCQFGFSIAALSASSSFASLHLGDPAARADGLASNSPTRHFGCAVVAVNAPPSGRPTLRSESVRLRRYLFAIAGLCPRTRFTVN
jgi:hypothetical protein